jgi:hypothetical protein
VLIGVLSISVSISISASTLMTRWDLDARSIAELSVSGPEVWFSPVLRRVQYFYLRQVYGKYSVQKVFACSIPNFRDNLPCPPIV